MSLKNQNILLLSIIGIFFASLQVSASYFNKQFPNNLEFFTTARGQSNVQEVWREYENGIFKTFETAYIHQKLSDSVYWFHIPPIKKRETSVFTYVAPYITKAQLFIVTNEKVLPLNKISTFEVLKTGAFYYRHPTWEIPKENAKHHLILKLDNAGEQRTRLEFHHEDKKTFLKRLQFEHLLAGAYISLLISLVIFLLYFAILNKEFGVVFYALYICSVVIEFLAAKSLGIQFIWNDKEFLYNNIRSSNQALGFLNLGLFYAFFYKYRKAGRIHQNVFIIGSIYAFLLLMGYVIKYAVGGMSSYFLFVWGSLKIAMIAFLINHIILSFKKLLPFYLAFFFALPKLTLILIQNLSFKYSYPLLIQFLLDNIFFFALTLEVFVFTRYIFKGIISNQKEYVQLKELNKKLETSFQNKILQTAQKERNAILADVHDSLGGYLAALQIRLSENLIDKDVFQKIINSFQKEYRNLLQNLHTPEIDINSLTDELVEYCNEMNTIHDVDITTEFNISNKKLSKENCLNIYRILTELITNALKHSEASNIKVGMRSKYASELEVFVEDNGKGFSKKTGKNNKSFGLNNIRSRVESFNGTFEINSDRKYGTLATVKIPN